MTALDERRLRAWAAESASRLELWSRFVNATGAATVAEIGVYRGAFAARLLAECAHISVYYMIDPWRHLDDWNKPANKPDDVFEGFYNEAMERTAAHEAKRIVLRGRTTEVIDEIPDGSLDFAYIDGDHTLRGITIDLVRVFGKVRDGGWVGGDDFSHSIWQHKRTFEPTMVFPYAVYFAEAVGARIFGLPRNQFLIAKTTGGRHEFVDLTGQYDELGLRGQFVSGPGSAPAPAEPPSLRSRVRRRLGV